MASPGTTMLAEHTARLYPAIEAALDAYTDLPAGCPARLREAMRYSLLAPGKRLRPVLVLMAAEACGGTVQAALPAACAVEMIHAYSLIHDDLPAMDDDDLRRGRPTCHKVFGEAMAILAGDALQALAFQVLATGIQPPTSAAACCAVLAEAAGPGHLVGGQADDVAGHAGGPGQSSAVPAADPRGRVLELLESIHHRKTGALIRASLRLGGVAVAAPAELLATLDEYGKRFGLAFQVTDDLLDVRSDAATAGKRVGKDAAKGKITFPGLLGVSQSIDYAKQLIAEACQCVAHFGARAVGLETLARYVVERNH